jgi:OmpA-OmpF porin, OOP family
MRLTITLLALLVGGCGLITVQQDPFPPLRIEAKKPAPPPPRVVLTDSKIEIREKVMFELGKAEIRPESFGLLDDIAQVMQENPQIEVVQVEGHTDSTGGADVNRRLSGERAASVKKYIVGKGIVAGRLTSKGFGPDVPIGDNQTDEGREQNRRVEFKIMKQGPKKTVVQEED